MAGDFGVDWEGIPCWDATNPHGSFAFHIHNISSRVPVTRLESWRDFPSLFGSVFFNDDEMELIFRGQRRFDWVLEPTISRSVIYDVFKEGFVMNHLKNFKKAIRGKVKDHSLLARDNSEDDEVWSVGQHHGLVTPLLDWTHSPYIALFFAFCESDKEHEPENPYRAVYKINKAFIKKLQPALKIRVFEPRKDDYGRAVNQAGLFTFCSENLNIERELLPLLEDESFEAHHIAQYICKVYIKNADQPECLKHLHKMNIHHGSLFPDIFGASEYCNRRFWGKTLRR